MSKSKFTGDYAIDGQKVSVQLDVYLWEEEGLHYAQCPALDITGYGKSAAEAKKSFEVMVSEFLSYTHRKKTIFKVLESLGWTSNKRKKRVVAPTQAQLLEDNQDLADVLRKPGVKHIHETLQLAL